MTGLRATAFVSWGVWVARCPRLGCMGSAHYGLAPVTNVVGNLTREAFYCNRCELSCPSQWPGNAVDIWRVLMQRPLEETRNWNLGETIEDLIAENIAHGVIAPADVVSGVLVADGALTDHGRQLVSAGPAAIGAL